VGEKILLVKGGGEIHTGWGGHVPKNHLEGSCPSLLEGNPVWGGGEEERREDGREGALQGPGSLVMDEQKALPGRKKEKRRGEREEDGKRPLQYLRTCCRLRKGRGGIHQTT